MSVHARRLRKVEVEDEEGREEMNSRRGFAKEKRREKTGKKARRKHVSRQCDVARRKGTAGEKGGEEEEGSNEEKERRGEGGREKRR